MPKLNKGRGYEVSKETETITILGKDYEIANLHKGGLTMQSVVLIAVEEKWHEIDVASYDGNGSDLQDFIKYVNTYNLTLQDFGIRQEKPIVDYSLKHDDFMELEALFPAFDYYKIGKLHAFKLQEGEKSGMYEMKRDLKVLSDRGMTINQHITWATEQKKQIINNPKSKFITMDEAIRAQAEARANQLIELGMVFYKDPELGPGKPTAKGFGFDVSHTSIEGDSIEDWNALIIRIMAAKGNNPVAEAIAEIIAPVINDTLEVEIVHVTPETVAATAEAIKPAAEQPATEVPAKKPVSLETIAALPASRIVELKDLEKNQKAIVVANPIITITDKASRDKAAESVKILLKASTAIDGKTGLLANFVTKTNQFIKMGKDYLTPLAKITRDQHDKQKAILEAWDNAETIRVQNETKTNLLKLQARTDILFKVPFDFNGEVYSVGTHYIMPSQIESMTDEEFTAAVKKGEELIAAAKSADDIKNEGIRKAAEMLREFNPQAADELLINAGLMERPVAAPVTEAPKTAQAVSATVTEKTATASAPVAQTKIEPAAAEKTVAQPAANTSGRFVASTVYVMPPPANKVVNTFDVQHMGLINESPINPNFLKCRAYFVEGTKQLANEIEAILNGENEVNGLKKSQRIAELCAVVKITE